jgi:hypothetical protein
MIYKTADKLLRRSRKQRGIERTGFGFVFQDSPFSGESEQEGMRCSSEDAFGELTILFKFEPASARSVLSRHYLARGDLSEVKDYNL